MATKRLSGVYTALFTPLKNDCEKRLYNSIDYEKTKLIIDDLISSGVSGIVPVGTTGQSATLSHKQHLDFIRFVVDYIGDRCEVIAGAGSNCTRESVSIINKIMDIKRIPVLCVTGYYNNPPRYGVKKHFETLAEETGAEIVLYNVPGRTNSYITADTVIDLAQNPQFIGLKQAVDFTIGGDHREDTLNIIKATEDMPFSVVSGEDDSLAQLIRDGGTGIISATANIPEALTMMNTIITEARQGNHEKAFELQFQLTPLIQACFSRKNPIPLGTFFNSPLYQPLCSVLETEDGEILRESLLELINSQAPSLKKYHP
ncbi:4-hydroxy-tetrahydrodipicolinate synthase [Chitinivibrio alkaliphilus]|uniref:4-hydroxy-tetrahydrodipicolinate synthase n=1 Tax=Chitinivibrio alkaliphilus ACht1 TaxID=1313304 RepID=U7D4K5_9BACT|nr:4-hydroxy-tetrahydrodipicolinate synthase [Chitinivibrio alkaliphilus]ERP31444.1 dihydrodipicolinate synthase [Chitinivibrio alkaliphilus ACht1]